MNFEKGFSTEENELSLNLTPLMDIMFILVIFFAVSTTFKVFPGISVNLPGAESENIKEEEKSVTAILTETGEVFLDGKPIERGQLADTLGARQKESPVSMFILEADRTAQHGQVVALMDAAKKAGILRLAISTRHEDDSGVPPN
jgi:biopolymer transport protein ExbD